jgi:adhesin transport system membrane fusion protein
MRSQDAEIITNVRGVILQQSPKGGRLLIWSTIVFLGFAVAWANQADIDEITRGDGKVIPSSQLQVVQNLEGGIVSELLVKEGDVIKKDQPLLKIDDVRFSSSYNEGLLNLRSLKLKAERLTAESKEQDFQPSADLVKLLPDVSRREKELYESRNQQLSAKTNILEQQQEQRKAELNELYTKRVHIRNSHQLAKRELELTEPLIKDGAVSEVDILRLKRTVNDLYSDLRTTEHNIPRALARLDEAKRKIEAEKLAFISEVRNELNDTLTEISRLEESNLALGDRVARTVVRSPVRGRINRMLVNTLGGVIQPGMDLVEIVPIDDTLLIEARIQPRDIGFLHPDQKAVVKFTAYDFAIYGGLDAQLEYISADSLTDEQGNPYYLVRVRTQETELKGKDGPLEIIPGMLTNVDIKTGKKTILEFLLKPVLRAKEYALRER